MKVAVSGSLESLTPEERDLLLRRRPDDEGAVRVRVREILAEVREGGDEALRDLARRYDGVELPALEVPREEWRTATETLDPRVRDALEEARRNLERFHREQVPADLSMEVRPGVRLGRRSVPLRRVGVYAPGGTAAYPSSVLMGAVPARAVGVEEVVVCSPPGPGGRPPAAILAACEIAGADRLFSLGGAGAVAALTWGTATVPRVDGIVGPGNRWVTEAKRQVAGEVRTDSPAGPSEVLVVAAGEADPRRIALELVAQAEHDIDAAVAVVSTSGDLLERIRTALEEEASRTPRRTIVLEALEVRGALLRAGSLDDALAFADAYAPEHLVLLTRSPRRDLEGIRNAGTVFLGESASVSFGDYLTGANHVLPTGGRARTFSGLSGLDFLRTFTWQELTPEAAREMAPSVEALADAEGLPAHAEAARSRREP